MHSSDDLNLLCDEARKVVSGDTQGLIHDM